MNSPLEQLASRNLDSTPLPIRPRLLSRFESGAAPQTEIGEDGVAELHEPQAHGGPARDTSSRQVHSPHESYEQPRPRRNELSGAPSPIVEIRQQELVPAQEPSPLPRLARQQPSDDRSGAISRRLDQLDRQLQGLAPRDETARALNAPAPSVSIEPVESISHEETHHHHQHLTEHNHHSQIIEQRDQQTVVVPPPERRASQHQPGPSIVAEGQPTNKSLNEGPGVTPQIIHRHIESNAPIPPPQVITEPFNPASPIEAARRGEGPSSVPQIIVEKNVSTEPASHTVTVTIGRIEVRDPRQGGPPTADKPKRPAPRIMSLDDYMRRRAGGVG